MKTLDTIRRFLVLPKYTDRIGGNGYGNGVREDKLNRNYFGIADESSFNRYLCVERRRSDRSGDPFALALLHVVPVWLDCLTEQKAALCHAICSRTRDTDLVGWYSHPSEIGIIYTVLGDNDRSTIELSISRKIYEGICEVLGPANARKVNLSFHFYPEAGDGNKPSFKSDEKLYPDLFKAGKSRITYSIIKRGLDVGGSLGAILLLSPVFLISAALIKLSSQGPVLFKQKRIGHFGREFTFLKFRTMYVNSDHEIHKNYIEKLIANNEKYASGGQDSAGIYKITADPRVTPVGRFLRRTSLDELPQFFNVLRGDMSLVGPRPPLPYEVALYRHWHRRRLVEVKPGITGLWQVYGRSRTSFDEMVRLDLRYVREQSLMLDLKIILKTPQAMLAGAGAY
jgi:lipopolysaccharide/colanic/teichoic acid biosynthesis glycosyltransferase